MRFQTFWMGRLSPYERLCLKSFTCRGHEIELFTYGDIEGECPDGVIVKNAGEIADWREFYVQRSGFGQGLPAPFADYFRYKLLYHRGGWWIDTDVVCLGNLEARSQFFAYQDDKWVNNAVLCFEPNNAAIGDCLKEASIMIRDHGIIAWGSTGPFLLTEALRRNSMLDKAEPPRTCYPIHDMRILDIFRPTEIDFVADAVRDSMFLHLWNARLVDNGIDKFDRPPAGSWLRKTADALEIDGWK